MTGIRTSDAPALEGNGQPAGNPAASETYINGHRVIHMERAEALISDEARADLEAWKAQEARDAQNAHAGLEALRQQYGEEAEAVRSVAKTFFDSLGEETKEKLLERQADGNSRLNDPDTVVDLVLKALDNIPPLKAILPQFGGDERAAIEHLMQFRHGPYYRGQWSEHLQLKYRSLLRG